MFFHVSDFFHGPVGVVSAHVRIHFYGDGVGWAKSYTSLAVNTVLVFTANSVSFFIIEVSIVGALVNAYFAANATSFVSFNEVFGLDVCFHYFKPPRPSFNLQTTGSPPLGHQNLSKFGETSRIADSSDERYV